MSNSIVDPDPRFFMEGILIVPAGDKYSRVNKMLCDEQKYANFIRSRSYRIATLRASSILYNLFLVNCPNKEIPKNGLIIIGYIVQMPDRPVSTRLYMIRNKKYADTKFDLSMVKYVE